MKYINGRELANKRFIKLDNGGLREMKGKFIPKIGECYWYIGAFGGIDYAVKEGTSDKWLLKRQLVFRTKEECEDYKRFLETLDQYTFEPNWEDEKQEKWFPRFNFDTHRLYFVCFSTAQCCGACFESREKGEAFVEVVGTEAVKRYMFGIWE